MRYQVGQKLPVIHFSFRGVEPFHNSFFRMPYLYDNTDVSKITITELEVTEHHKVAVDYDPDQKKDCDGYLLKAVDGTIYANQYPQASYGQTTDTGNRRFHGHHEEGTDVKALIEKMKSGEVFIPEYHLFDDAVSDIRKGIEDVEKSLEKDADTISKDVSDRMIELKTNLEQLLTVILFEYEIAFPGKTFELVKKPLWEKIDLLFWRVEFKDIEGYAEQAQKVRDALTAPDTPEEPASSHLSLEYVHHFENKDQLAIVRQTAHYASYAPGEEVAIMYGDYTPDYLDDGKDAWMACASERYSVANLDRAVAVFMARLRHNPTKVSNHGQSYEEIFGAKQAT